MKGPIPKTIDEYIQADPEESQKIMQNPKELTESTVLSVQSEISQNVSIYEYNRILARFDVAKNT